MTESPGRLLATAVQGTPAPSHSMTLLNINRGLPTGNTDLLGLFAPRLHHGILPAEPHKLTQT